jgi:hypothetical protein
MRNSQMSSTSRLIQLFAIVVTGFFPIISAHADPITITGVSGIATLINSAPSARGTVNIAGDGFSANVTTFNGSFGLGACTTSRVTGCTSANLGWFSSDLGGTVTFNGVVFIPTTLNQLSLTFTSITFVIPPEFLNSSAIQITAPFTFSGRFSRSQFPTEPIILSGEGTVSLLLVNRTIGGFNGFFLDHADYVFGPQASGLTIEPVPEPATILLLVSGLAGTVLRLKKRT